MKERQFRVIIFKRKFNTKRSIYRYNEATPLSLFEKLTKFPTLLRNRIKNTPGLDIGSYGKRFYLKKKNYMNNI